MNPYGLRIRADRRIHHGDAIQFYGFAPAKPGRIEIVENLVLADRAEGSYSDPFMTLPATAAQELMDDLWRCGLRPTEGSGSAGSLAATERHLNDMRALFFASRSVPMPK